MAAVIALALLVGASAQWSFAQKTGPKTFASPSEASSALFQAVQSEDEEAVERILGAGKEVTSSSDEVEDKLERERFGQKYQEMHRLVQEPDGTTVLYIGAENWPFPIPLVSKNGAWYFDSDTGTQEIMFRTVGENETTAIQVCRALAKEKEQSETNVRSDDPTAQYAQSLASGRTANADNTAFHGYYFRLVTGNNIAGTDSHVSRAKKTGGLAWIAYPAQYGSSGVMTFIVMQDGEVYEKDLGPKTTTVAPAMKKRSHASSWRPADGAPAA
jgi:hypothetical protein